MWIIIFLSFIGRWNHFKNDARGLSKNIRNKQPLPIPVFSVSDTDEEDFPAINSLNIAPQEEQRSTSEEDVSVINSQDIKLPEERMSTQTGKSGEDTIITVQDSDREKDDFEMYEESDSFWEDSRRLTDSWYGIKKITGETVPDDSYDEMCLQALLNVENNNNNNNLNRASNMGIQALLNVENKNLNNTDIMNDDVVIDDDDDFDEEFDKVVGNYQY